MAGSPCTMRRRSRSTRLATSAHEVDVDDRHERRVGPTKAPGSRLRLPTKPSTGDTMRVFARLMRSSSRRACACANCARARSTCATRRLVAGLGVVQRLARDQVAPEEVLRALEVGLGELEIGFTLADGRPRRRRTTRRSGGPAPGVSRSSSCASNWPSADRVAQPHVHRFEPAADLGHHVDRGGADQVADHRDALGDGEALRRRRVSTVIVGRNAPPRPPPAGPPAGRGGLRRAVGRTGFRVRPEAERDDDGHDSENECFTHTSC